MSLSKKDKKIIIFGAKAGALAGVVFGAMMGMMGMLPMVAKLVNSGSSSTGFVVHIAISIILGAIFAVIFDAKIKGHGESLMWGVVYGIAWWVIGPLLIMPVWLGMGPQLSSTGIQMALPSLWGHIIFGFILGLMYRIIANKMAR